MAKRSGEPSQDPGPSHLPELEVDLADLRRRGVDHERLQVVLPTPWIAGALRDTDAEVGAPGEVRAEVMLQPDGTVLIRGQLQVGFRVPCARCLEPSPVEAAGDLCLTFLPAQDPRAKRLERQDAAEEEVTLEEADLDTFVYRGHTLDLGTAVGEQVALAYPMRVLCSRGSACRGLCGSCGADLNRLAPTALECAKCGRPLREVSQAEADHRPAGDEEGELAPWKEALRKLQQDN